MGKNQHSARLGYRWSFNEEETGQTGKLPWRGEGWYRKIFTVDESEKGKVVYFLFDGIMANPKMYINGELAGQWDYGYNSFYINATEFVRFRRKTPLRCMWIPETTEAAGIRCGIYRKVRMLTTNPVHAEIWGTYITTPVVEKSHAEMRML